MYQPGFAVYIELNRTVMSFTFDYISTEPVPEPIAAQISVQAKRFSRSIDWWAEPLSLEQDVDSKRLVGGNRISLGGGYGAVRISEPEDSLMMCRDVREIVKILVQWSQRYNITWELGIAGHSIGQVVPGEPNSTTVKLLGTCEQPSFPESKIPGILKKYESRKR